MMPEMNGREFCEMLRSGKTNFCKKMPIIMVSALYETPDRVGGIADGGDDYLVKPFEPEELSVRVQALLRRSPPHRDIDINILYDDDGCTLNMQTQCLHIHDIVLELSDKEALFLKMLIQSVNVPINKHEITRHLYPEAINSPDSRTAEVMIGRLRKKLEENNCQKIITKRGDGYYWQVL
ncbi:MAG: OmpR family response regulator RpaB [Alphaproteobacteria bacterium]|jgi:OmpR family response regulator RpaB